MTTQGVSGHCPLPLCLQSAPRSPSQPAHKSQFFFTSFSLTFYFLLFPAPSPASMLLPSRHIDPPLPSRHVNPSLPSCHINASSPHVTSNTSSPCITSMLPPLTSHQCFLPLLRMYCFSKSNTMYQGIVGGFGCDEAKGDLKDEEKAHLQA
jgi:hypothetical protein